MGSDGWMDSLNVANLTLMLRPTARHVAANRAASASNHDSVSSLLIFGRQMESGGTLHAAWSDWRPRPRECRTAQMADIDPFVDSAMRWKRLWSCGHVVPTVVPDRRLRAVRPSPHGRRTTLAAKLDWRCGKAYYFPVPLGFSRGCVPGPLPAMLAPHARPSFPRRR